VLKNHFDSLAAASNLKNTIFNPSNDFYHNQPIIITKNYPDFGLFNGDIGIVRKSVEDDNLKAYFIDGDNQGKLKAISPGFIAESETVFAMTIHKSQGSEFKQVLVVLPKKAKIELLTRELIYTAVTRAKEKATIQGTEDVLLAATERKVQRASGITERILIKE
jgi:exodeoxyribonuclease V alpha subunit